MTIRFRWCATGAIALAVAISAPSPGAQVALHALHEGVAQPGDDFGASIGNRGDADGDGWDDVVVGAPGRDPGGLASAGAVIMFSGRTGAVLWERAGAAAHDRAGASVDFIGDVNGDGSDDVVVGSPGASGGDGRVDVLSGSDGAPLFAPDAGTAGSALGFAVAGVGLVDGDDVPDLAAGAPHGEGAASQQTGFVRVYSGADLALIDTFEGDAGGDGLGTSLSGLADVDDDGHDDLILGAPQLVWANTNGYVRVVSGATGAVLHTFGGFSQGDTFGRDVADAGDVDGDGTHDIVIGATQEHTDRAGYARVYSGATWQAIETYQAIVAGDELGADVAGVGDVDCDSLDDVAVASPLHDWPFEDGGRVTVESVVAEETLLDVRGQSNNSHIGRVAGGGDTNRDGLADVVVAEAYGPGAGAVWVYCGLPPGCRNDATSVDADANGIPDDCEAWTDLGHGLAGWSSLTPTLAGEGFLIAGKPMRVMLASARPAATAWLVVSTATLFAPFKGGTLVPDPSGPGALVVPLPTGAQGEVFIEAAWLSGVPSGFSIFIQYWIEDRDGPVGFSASAAIRGTTP